MTQQATQRVNLPAADVRRLDAGEAVRPVRLQRRRAKGFRLTSPNGLPIVCVTRPGRWGNPYVVGRVCRGVFVTDREMAIDYFRAFLKNTYTGQELAAAAAWHLRGKNLACYCKLDEACHADVLLELANAPTLKGPVAHA